jgi:hypothetical protein
MSLLPIGGLDPLGKDLDVTSCPVSFVFVFLFALEAGHAFVTISHRAGQLHLCVCCCVPFSCGVNGCMQQLHEWKVNSMPL